MTTQPGDDTAAGQAGHGHLRASHADREHVIGSLKAAYVQGMLTKDEFDLRVGQTFASRTCIDLAALTADLPAMPAAAQPPRPAQPQGQVMRRPGRMIAVATALYAGVWAFILLPPWPTNSEGDPPKALFMLLVLSTISYLLALPLGVVNMVVLWRGKRSRRQPPRRPAPSAPAPRRLPSAGPDRQLPPADPGHRHTADAAPIIRPRLLPS